MAKGLVTTLFCTVISLTFSLILHYTYIAHNSDWWWSLIFFISLSILSLIRFFNFKSAQKNTEIILSVIIIKTILLFFAVFLYALYDKSHLISFSVHFILHYILFTIFEIRYLLNFIKHQNI